MYLQVCLKQSFHRIIESWNTRLDGALEGHLLPTFLSKAESRQDGPAPCPAESCVCSIHGSVHPGTGCSRAPVDLVS